MDVWISEARLAEALHTSLKEAGCPAVVVGERIVQISREPGDEALVELAFFLRAWQLDNPEAAVELRLLPRRVERSLSVATR